MIYWGLAPFIMIFTGRGRGDATAIVINWGFDNTYFDTRYLSIDEMVGA